MIICIIVLVALIVVGSAAAAHDKKRNRKIWLAAADPANEYHDIYEKVKNLGSEEEQIHIFFRIKRLYDLEKNSQE